MRALPPDVPASALAAALATQWALTIDRLDYLPVGGGAYHWVVVTDRGARWFVTCDDLDLKPWLGDHPDAVYNGLCAAYRAAAGLRRNAARRFVVPPVPTPAGQLVVRLGARHSVAVFPFVEGRSGRWGERLDAAELTRIAELLAELHGSTAAVDAPPRGDGRIPGRRWLVGSLADLRQPWHGGPFAEPLRAQLGACADLVVDWLTEFDRLSARLATARFQPVVTHGEPHPGNLIHTPDGLAMVAWDTVSVDRAERDLWMLGDETGSAFVRYTELTGRPVDPEAARLYELAWVLNDLAAFTAQLRGPHRDDADARKAWMAVLGLLRSEEPAPYGRDPRSRGAWLRPPSRNRAHAG